MTTRKGAGAINAIGAIAVITAVIALFLAMWTLAFGRGVPVARTAAVFAAPAPFLFLSAMGLFNRRRWGQILGILTFGGMALANIVTLFVLSIIGIGATAILTGCALYLLFASEEFDDSSGERNVQRVHKP